MSGNGSRRTRNAIRTEVRDPVLDFIVAFAQPLKKISQHFLADPRANGGSLFRIYRDTRFSKDKTPYKTNVGALACPRLVVQRLS